MIRTKILNFFLFSISLVFFSYVFYIQCFRHQYYEKKAKQQHEKKFILLGARGNIYDRSGVPIASSEPCFSIFCTPRYAGDVVKLAREIARISKRSLTQIRHLVDKGDFFWVDMKVDIEASIDGRALYNTAPAATIAAPTTQGTATIAVIGLSYNIIKYSHGLGAVKLGS